MSKSFGSYPQIDRFIERGDPKNPSRRWMVGAMPFKNLELARERVRTDWQNAGISPVSVRQPNPSQKTRDAISRKTRTKLNVKQPHVPTTAMSKSAVVVVDANGVKVTVQHGTSEDIAAVFALARKHLM